MEFTNYIYFSMNNPLLRSYLSGNNRSHLLVLPLMTATIVWFRFLFEFEEARTLQNLTLLPANRKFLFFREGEKELTLKYF